MDKTPNLDLNEAHHFFSAECFNLAWNYIDKPVRTPEEDRYMLLLGMASLWHWTQRPDATPGNYSIGYWQVARIYALLGQPDNARQYGLLCLENSQCEGCQPFHLGYAYEALARAEALAGDSNKADAYLRLARQVSENMSDPEDRKRFLEDLATIN